ncbi:Hint domain-containing protein (plasmid) [Paracoccus liaowanqingii]|uniref:Hint domain-containing protein n=1 Tax=Paracoccus liaowanqingii TaxID=2560053 RepID=A0A4Y5SRW4_9RHOB|nr:Hint domain-containing protein [Paracoccus liaowanqingii]QDA35708.1 Hint domain-containing protein [Paracoccus liaowanqingii]
MPSIDIVRTDGNPHETVNGIREDTNSRGADLQGSTITATYADGSTETLTWRAFDPYTNGGATGTDIEMSYGFEWHELTTTKLLTSLQIDLQPASSVFDTTLANENNLDESSTPGSLNGYPFSLAPEYEEAAGEISVTYSGIVNLEGNSAVGDLYTTMVVDFSKLPAGGLLGDLRWNSDIDTMREAGDLVPSPTSVPCLVRGTLITTDRGDVLVEDLKAGCKVLTQDNGFQELVLTMSRIIDTVGLRKNENLYPVRITAGALGSGFPKRDLVVSRQHRMAVNSNIVKRMFGSATALVAAIRLTELPGIYIDNTVESVEYFHLVFKQHEVVFAEGAPTESFLIGFEAKNILSKAQRDEFAALFPEVDEIGYLEAPAHTIPSRMLQKELVRRHMKNAKNLLSL